MEEIFANRLKKLRMNRGYTQEQLAVAVNISVKTIQNYEQGVSNPNIDFLLCLAEILDVTPEYLYKGEVHMNTYTKAITYELEQLKDFSQIDEIKSIDFNDTILSHLELGEQMITNIQSAWIRNRIFKDNSVCYRNYVKDVVIKYCQNRSAFKIKFGIRDGMIANSAPCI